MARYATALEMRSQIDMTTATKDAEIEIVLEGACDTIDRVCNRPDGFLADTVVSARYYVGTGEPYLLIDECVEIGEVAVKDAVSDEDYTAWDSPTTNMAGDGDWLAASGDPLVPNFNVLPYNLLLVDINGDYSRFIDGKLSGLWGWRAGREHLRRGVPTVRVTAKWGYSVDVPDDIVQAALMQAARWWKRSQSAMADVLASGELGTLLYRQVIDPEVKLILIEGRYIKPTMGGRW
jgi:hypothetical protein